MKTEWIDYSKQKPTTTDFSPTQCVEYINKDGIRFFDRWFIDSYSRVTHWRRVQLPPPPQRTELTPEEDQAYLTWWHNQSSTTSRDAFLAGILHAESKR